MGTIPVVLKRLREKSNEWEGLKNEMEGCWKSVAQKNYFKAHDFRYTIFKQYDAKRIALKNILKQIEERHNNREPPMERTNHSELDCFEKYIASPSFKMYRENGNGVVSGVGLHVELGDYVEPNNKTINNHDYRFVVCKQDI